MGYLYEEKGNVLLTTPRLGLIIKIYIILGYI